MSFLRNLNYDLFSLTLFLPTEFIVAIVEEPLHLRPVRKPKGWEPHLSRGKLYLHILPNRWETPVVAASVPDSESLPSPSV